MDALRSAWVCHALLLAALLAILLLRDASILTAPALRFEDGSHIFAFFYQQRDPAALLRFKAGYIPLWPNLIGFLSVRLPSRWIPYGLAMPALGLTLLSYSTFFSHRYRCYVRSDLLRGLACLLMALAPLTHYDLLSSLDYSIWNCLLLLILLGLLPAPASWLGKGCLFLAIPLLSWSHPLGLVTLPLFLYWLWRDPPGRWLYLYAIVSLIAYQIFGVAHGAPGAISGAEGAAAMLDSLKTLILSVGFSLELLFRATFGPLFYSQLLAHGNSSYGILLIFAILMAAPIGLVLRNEQEKKRHFTLFILYLVAGITLLGLLGRGQDYFAANLNGRYGYVQQLLSYLLLAAILETVTAQFGSLAFARYARLWIVAWMLMVFMAMNMNMGYYNVRRLGKPGWGPYGQDPMASQAVAAFFQRLERSEALPQPVAGPRRLRLERESPWSIDVLVRSHASR